MTTILHVEDDLSLSELVRLSFDSFGFRGHFLSATTVAVARSIIDELRRYPTIDLVLSDMRLPDGTGLDVLRALRAHPAREAAPALILSGESDQKIVDRAYALGASSFVGKEARGRWGLVILQEIFEHWLTDARLPTPAGATGRTARILSRAVGIRRRFGNAYLELADKLDPDSAKAELWMDSALREGNLANLIAFLLGQLGAFELPPELLDEADAVQADNLQLLDELERHPIRTEEDATRFIRGLIDRQHLDWFVRFTSLLFPIAHAVTPTLREVAATRLEGLATWIESYATDPDLRARVPFLRAEAVALRKPQILQPERPHATL